MEEQVGVANEARAESLRLREQAELEARQLKQSLKTAASDVEEPHPSKEVSPGTAKPQPKKGCVPALCVVLPPPPVDPALLSFQDPRQCSTLTHVWEEVEAGAGSWRGGGGLLNSVVIMKRSCPLCGMS